METVHTEIKTTIKRARPGQLFRLSDFRGVGTDAAVKKTMSRLAQEKLILRLSHGIYYKPKEDPVLGPVKPTIDEIIKTIAEKDGVKIKPTGVSALHMLGLTTQVPMRRVYLTDGNAKQLKIGKITVTFKRTSPKKFAMKGKISSLLISAMEEFGAQEVTLEIKTGMKKLLQQEDPKILKHDLQYASAKVSDQILQLLKPAA